MFRSCLSRGRTRLTPVRDSRPSDEGCGERFWLGLFAGEQQTAESLNGWYGWTEKTHSQTLVGKYSNELFGKKQFNFFCGRVLYDVGTSGGNSRKRSSLSFNFTLLFQLVVFPWPISSSMAIPTNFRIFEGRGPRGLYLSSRDSAIVLDMSSGS